MVVENLGDHVGSYAFLGVSILLLGITNFLDIGVSPARRHQIPPRHMPLRVSAWSPLIMAAAGAQELWLVVSPGVDAPSRKRWIRLGFSRCG